MAWDFSGAFGRGWEQGKDISEARRRNRQEDIETAARKIAGEDRQRKIEHEVRDRSRQRDLDEERRKQQALENARAYKAAKLAEKIAGIRETKAEREPGGNDNAFKAAQLREVGQLLAEVQAEKQKVPSPWLKLGPGEPPQELLDRESNLRMMQSSLLPQVGGQGIGERMARPAPGSGVASPPVETREERIRRLMKNQPAGGIGGARRP